MLNSSPLEAVCVSCAEVSSSLLQAANTDRVASRVASRVNFLSMGFSCELRFGGHGERPANGSEPLPVRSSGPQNRQLVQAGRIAFAATGWSRGNEGHGDRPREEQNSARPPQEKLQESLAITARLKAAINMLDVGKPESVVDS
ncbi:MAG: hypothetical protein ABIR39_23045 [Nocardioides sp.]|uniref:hypothetical protein n=1 Tax=Nocardioides sp. TaxID=35761 RepID=UPI003266BDDF